MIKVTIIGLNTASSRGNRTIFQGEIGRFKFVFSVEGTKSSFSRPSLLTTSKKELYGNSSKNTLIARKHMQTSLNTNDGVQG